MRRVNLPDSSRWWQGLGIEFWLPLPLLTLIFGVSCSLMTVQGLNRAYRAQDKLQADSQLEVHLSVKPATIQAVIHLRAHFTQVEVQTHAPIAQKLAFDFPLIHPDQIEESIAQALQLPRQEVRKLVHYEIVN